MTPPGLLVITPPDYATFALVTVASAKQHLIVDAAMTDDDALIQDYINAAIEDVEDTARRAIAPQQWTLTLDRFPDARGDLFGVSPFTGDRSSLGAYGSSAGGAGPDSLHRGRWTHEIRVPKPPLVSVDEIRYVAFDGTVTVLATDQYAVDITSLPGRITPAFGLAWPMTRAQPRAVEVDFSCGFADPATVPFKVKAAVLLAVGDLYRNRESQIVGVSVSANPTAMNLLSKFLYREFA